MCTSLFQDESRRLTCKGVRLDEGLFVGYGVDLGRAVSAAGPRALSSTTAPCGGRGATAHLGPCSGGCFLQADQLKLVLQASTLAKGGDVFLLAIGEPVRIKDLAEQIVRLSGLSLRDARNPNGDIEIVCTDLRPGERLYEELLIEAESQPTKHLLIFRTTERSLHQEDLWPRLDELEEALKSQNQDKALEIHAELVPE